MTDNKWNSGISAGSKLLVFWDVVDYPIPEGRSIREILSFLNKGGEIIIRSYGETEINPFPADGEITYVHSSVDKYGRLQNLLVDVGVSVVIHPDTRTSPIHLLVVANNCEDGKDFADLFEELSIGRDYQILLVIPDGTPLSLFYKMEGLDPSRVPKVDSIWKWIDFLQGLPPTYALTKGVTMFKRHD